MRTTAYVLYQKLTMCCWGRRREGVHCKKPVSILDRVCDISSKIWVGGRLRRMMLMTLPGQTVVVVVHYYSRWMRYSVAHSRRGATARVMRSSTREHSTRSNFARPSNGSSHTSCGRWASTLSTVRLREMSEPNDILYYQHRLGGDSTLHAITQHYLSISSFPSPLNLSSSCFHGFQSAPYFRRSRDNSSRCSLWASH